MTEKPHGNTGKIRSAETRRKIAEAKRGKPRSAETKRKISEANSGKNHPMFGKTHSDETKRKISEARTGKKHTDEAKMKISEANRGKNNPMFGKQVEDKIKTRVSVGVTESLLLKKYFISEQRIFGLASGFIPPDNETEQWIVESRFQPKKYALRRRGEK